MEQSTTIINSRDFFGQIIDLSSLFDIPVGEELIRQWPKEFGDGFFNLIKVRPGVLLSMCEYLFHKPIVVHVDTTILPISIGFCMGGDRGDRVSYEMYSETDITFEIGDGFVCYRPEWQGTSSYPSGVPIRFVNIYIDREVLLPFFEDCIGCVSPDLGALLNGDMSISCIEMFSSTPDINTTIHQVFNCPYQGTLKRVYLESKTLELITYSVSRLSSCPGEGGPEQSLRSYEADSVRLAGTILKANLDSPPTLKNLARRVGLNKDKLNRGFHEIYGTSVFEFLRISRLEKAREILKKKEKNVTEVAFYVGYHHPKNFTRAFKTHFGTNPSEYLR